VLQARLRRAGYTLGFATPFSFILIVVSLFVFLFLVLRF